jgi:hypothetical protein
MRILVSLVIGVSLFASACGKKRDWTKEFDAIVDRVDRCTDPACVEKVQADLGHLVSSAKNLSSDEADAMARALRLVGAAREKLAERSKGLAAIAALRDRMCACADAACAKKVQSEMLDLLKGPPLSLERATAMPVMDAFDACKSKFLKQR